MKETLKRGLAGWTKRIDSLRESLFRRGNGLTPEQEQRIEHMEQVYEETFGGAKDTAGRSSRKKP